MKISLQQLCLLTVFLFSQLGYAQDNVILTSGEELTGKVTAIDDEEISFIHENESLTYTYKISDLLKITFESGRVQFFRSADDSRAQASLEPHYNRVAILPFGYINDKGTVDAALMQKKIQQEMYGIFKKKAVNLEFLDPSAINTALAKAGITNNLDHYSMGEIADILGVEYVVQGLVTVQYKSSTAVSSTSSRKETKDNNVRVDHKGRIIGNIWGRKEKSNSSTLSTSSDNYSTDVLLNIYTDKGTNVFSKTHTAFWMTVDAYKVTLSWLAKRTPLYKK